MEFFLFARDTTLFGICILLIAIAPSCKNKEPHLATLSAFIQSSTEVNIAFGNRLDSNQVMMDTTITDDSEVEKIKSFIPLSGNKDTCYELSGSITFLRSSGDGFLIDFGITPQCPAYYFYTEDRPISFRMSYQSGMYLAELHNTLLKIHRK